VHVPRRDRVVEAKRRAQAAVDSFLAAGHAARPAHIVLREGDARRAILDVAAQHCRDLVALGSHARSGLAHVLLGSVAEAVIRAATCNVLVARELGAPVV
jgi:universal stress protein A